MFNSPARFAALTPRRERPIRIVVVVVVVASSNAAAARDRFGAGGEKKESRLLDLSIVPACERKINKR
jgi:hypothetical protein